MPDPASQFQPDGVHGHSQVLDHGAYAWRVDEWRGRPWHEAVIYELHVGLFGSYAEVERFLPRLVELGVTAGADATGRVSRSPQLGLRRRAAVRPGVGLTARPSNSSI